MRKYLYLLLALVAGLGGCSRCGRDDPGPQHPPLSIVHYGYESGREGICSLPLGLTKGYVEVITYNRPQTYESFAPSDTSWPEYEWRFASSEQVIRRRTNFLYHDEQSLDDTVYLTCRDRQRHDSAKAKFYYAIRPLAAWPYYGTYKGKLYYQGSRYENFSLRFFHNPQDEGHEVIQVTGLFQGVCGAERDLYFPDAAQDLIVNFTATPGGSLSHRVDLRPCNGGFFYSPAALFMVRNWQDSVKLKITVPSVNYGPGVPPVDSVVFKGKKQP